MKTNKDGNVVKHHLSTQSINLMSNHKEHMQIILEDVDKPESIGNLEVIWFF